MALLIVPDIVLEKIFSYMSYDEIARKRLVCTVFNQTCQRLLNRGFTMMERRHNATLKAVKVQLPRRESERKFHALARHCDILTSIETRISMLSMTYTKYIDQNMCCFIPGKVIDEILRVLSLLDNSQAPPRAHEVLQELRDISSMAIEHFDEKISPVLKQKQMTRPLQSYNIGHSAAPYDRHITQHMLRGALNKMNNETRLNKLTNEMLTKRFCRLGRQLKRTNQIQAAQRKQIRLQKIKLDEQTVQIGELKRRIEEWDAKYSEITANINQISGMEPVSAIMSSSKISNIKPRAALISLKRSPSYDNAKDETKKTKYS